MVDSYKDDEMDEILKHQAELEGNIAPLKGTLLKLRKRFDFSSTRNEAASQDGGAAIQQLAQQQAEFIRLISSSFNTASNSSSSSTVVAQNASPHTDVKLPRMNLPTFGGNILEWPSIFDLFDSAVHKNVVLQDSQKLYFLKTNLVEEADALISHLRIEDANYAPALAKLKARYNKPLEIAAQHIHRFLNQQSMTSPSAAGLRSLHDVSDEVIRALEAMNQEGRDIWLLYILAEKLDPESKQLWCQKRSELKDEQVTLERLLKFIDAQSCALKSVQPIHQKKPMFITPFPSKHSTRGPTALVTTGHFSPPLMCVFLCKITASTVSAWQNRCENCLKQHSGEPCQSGNCRKCNLPHHTRLHEALQSTAASTTGNSTAATTNIYGSSSMPQTLIAPLCRATDFMDTNVLLLTATINVLDKFGRPHACRAVLDCASHTSYITEDLCSVQLADPQFHHPGKVSILLGNKLFFQLLEPGRINLGLDDWLPVLQNTKLGWVVSGDFKDCDNQPHTNAPSCLLTAPNDPFSDQLRKFWELEEYTQR
ncbi:uncharacterized protein LOC135704270 [Ochlerotatus camptorhynchus]|uniref:uncharacterized protein LOC135704270 n=1 Tax=Ochlerotatus camptorhynchus TaxID=644619 RepID=UPI0031E42CC9